MKPCGGLSFAVLVVVLLAGCGGSGVSERDAEHPPVSSGTPSAVVPAKTSACEDTRGDGGPMDLLSTTITTGDSVVVTADLAGPIPRNDTVTVSVMVQSRDGDTFRILAVKWVNGRAVNQYVYSLNGINERQHNAPPSGVRVHGKTVTMTFPASTMDDLGGRWTWAAFTGARSRYTDASGTDVDACPGVPGSMRMQPF